MYLNQQPFVSAELAYRAERVGVDFAQHRRRHHTGRRRTLSLPRPRLRPLHLA